MAETARILVVEDDRDNLGMISFMLKRLGYSVLEAHDGQEGVDTARKEMPDLILLDLAMPEMDGWTAARILKSDPATQKIKIVVVSVRSLLEDRRRAQDAGVDGYITKPMSMAIFAEEVARFLQLPEK
jgi:two-component system, cell cycle response regulator DivK